LVNVANSRIAEHRDNLILAQENVKDMKDSREESIRQIKLSTEKQLQEMRGQLLERRDEIARFEQRIKDHDYADSLIVDALNHLDRAEFQLAFQNMEMALEQSPEHTAALHLKQEIEAIINDPVEREIRRNEIVERDSLREVKRAQLLKDHLSNAQKSMKSGDFGQAIDLSERALALKPDLPKDAENARRILNQAQEKNREITLMILEAKQEIAGERFKEATAIIRSVLKQSPSNQEAKALQESMK